MKLIIPIEPSLARPICAPFGRPSRPGRPGRRPAASRYVRAQPGRLWRANRLCREKCHWFCELISSSRRARPRRRRSELDGLRSPWRVRNERWAILFHCAGRMLWNAASRRAAPANGARTVNESCNRLVGRRNESQRPESRPAVSLVGVRLPSPAPVAHCCAQPAGRRSFGSSATLGAPAVGPPPPPSVVVCDFSTAREWPASWLVVAQYLPPPHGNEQRGLAPLSASAPAPATRAPRRPGPPSCGRPTPTLVATGCRC